VSLDMRGRPVILAFYPGDWSPVCSDQLALYQELLPEFRKYNAQLRRRISDHQGSAVANGRQTPVRLPQLPDHDVAAGRWPSTSTQSAFGKTS
jgi:peroxiredoxin